MAITFLLMAFMPVCAAGQHDLAPGRYISTNCYSGVSIKLDASGQFDIHKWSDVVTAGAGEFCDSQGNCERAKAHPFSYVESRQGIYVNAGDSLRLTYVDIVLDTTKLAKEYEGPIRWSVLPEQWKRRELEELNRAHDKLYVRSIDSLRVLVAPDLTFFSSIGEVYMGQMPSLPRCRRAVRDTYRNICERGEPCDGILIHESRK